jgi:hypothetical protein
VFAPENADQQTAGDYYLAWAEHRFQVDDSWGAEGQLRDILNNANLPAKQTIDWGHFWDEWTPV